MSDEQKGAARATGALVTFFAAMQQEVAKRSPEYQKQFWKELQDQMQNIQGLEGMTND